MSKPVNETLQEMLSIFYDAALSLKLNNGETIRLEQAVKTEWHDGKIINERYYHA